MRIRRRAAGVVAALSAGVLALAACSGSGSDGGGGSEPSDGPAVEEVVIGAPLPLSGPGAGFGTPYLTALQLTVDAINEAGGIESLGGAKLRLDAVDDASDATRDAQLLQQMAAQGVSVFAGPLLSATVINSVPIITRAEIPFVGPSLDSAVTDPESPWMFRVVNRADAWGDQAFEWIDATLKEQGVTIEKIGVVGINVPPGTSTTERMIAGAEAAGWEAVNISYDQKTTTDFAPIVAQLAQADVDLVTGYQNPNDAVLFAQAVAAQDWRPEQGFVWIAGGQYLSSFGEATGASTNHWVDLSYAADLSASPVPELEAIAAAFQEETGQPMVGLAASAPAIITVIAAAIEKAASPDPAKIADALRSLEFSSPDSAPFPYYSMRGGLSFNEKNGDNLKWEGTMIQWQDGVQVDVSDPSSDELIWPAR